MAKEPRPIRVKSVTWVSAAIAMLMVAQQIASKAVRDGFFLESFDVTALPVATAGASVLSLVAALLIGRFMRALSPATSVPILFGINALLFIVEARFVESYPQWVAAFLYLHVAALSAGVISGFWSVINERFDPFTAKTVVGRVAGGATLGGMLGGGATWLVADLAPAEILVGLGFVNLVCAIILPLVGRGVEAPKEKQRAGGLLDGVRVVSGKSYPRTIAMLVFLVALTTACFDYAFKAAASEVEGQSLVGFFALFYTATGIVTFVVQAIGSKRLLKRLGVTATIAILPVVIAVFLVVALFYPELWAFVLLRGAAMVVENSLYRSGYELLYTPMPKEQKRSAKILIDLGCDRLGGALGSAITLVVLAVAAAFADQLLIIVALVLTIVTLGVLSTVKREYVTALASRIRHGASDVPSDTVSEALPVAGSFSGDDMAFLRPVHRRGLEPSLTTTALSAPLDRTELLQRLAEHALTRLRKDDPLHVELPALISTRLVDTPLVTQLSADACDDEHSDHWMELRRSAPAMIGQLTDVLLSTRHLLEVRLRAAELLSEVPTERSVVGLHAGLGAPEFRVRRAAGIALLRVVERAPSLRPSRRKIIELARTELRRPTRTRGDSRIERSSLFRVGARGHVIAPSLEHTFTLLAVVGDAQALQLALSAITAVDPAQRGTGLEYLDNLLPGDVRPRLLSLVGRPDRFLESAGVQSRCVRELAEQLRTGAIGLAELRAQFQKARRSAYDSTRW